MGMTPQHFHTIPTLSHTLSFTAALAIHTLGNTSPGSMHIPDLCYTTRPWLLECSQTLQKINCSCMPTALYVLVDIIAMNIIFKQNGIIAASISIGLPENRRLVRVLFLRTISGKCNTRWFMLFFCVWIVVIASAVIVLSWWRKKVRR